MRKSSFLILNINALIALNAVGLICPAKGMELKDRAFEKGLHILWRAELSRNQNPVLSERYYLEKCEINSNADETKANSKLATEVLPIGGDPLLDFQINQRGPTLADMKQHPSPRLTSVFRRYCRSQSDNGHQSSEAKCIQLALEKLCGSKAVANAQNAAFERIK